MRFAEGEVGIELTRADGRVVGVAVQSTRPTAVSRVLEGKPVGEALAAVPLLFSLCGRAQAVAGVTAAEGALGMETEPATLGLRCWLAAAEQTQEYLWRLLVDLPAAVGEAAAVAGLADWRQRFAALAKRIQGEGGAQQPGAALRAPDAAELAALSDALAVCLETAVFGREGSAWPTAAAFEQWLARGETVVARALRQFDGASSLSDLGARSEPGGRARPNRSDFEAHSGLYATRNRDDLGRSPAGAVGASQVRQAARQHERYPLPRLAAGAAGDALRDLAARMLTEPAFCAAPQWRGTHPETGALARRWDSPLIGELRAARCDPRLLRQAARLEELAAAATLLRTVPEVERAAQWLGGGVLEAGCGYGWVETARGLLLHALRIAEGRVAAYRILAPTEWNFHPQGPLSGELMGWPALDAGELERQARLAVLALDPCVGFKVVVNDA